MTRKADITSKTESERGKGGRAERKRIGNEGKYAKTEGGKEVRMEKGYVRRKVGKGDEKELTRQKIRRKKQEREREGR